MRYAISTSPQRTTWPWLLDVWQRADRHEVFESGWTFDHLYPLFGDSTEDCLEGWITLTALLHETERLRGGVLVTGMVYRHPGVLANMASTLDITSGGRLELGIGAGWNEEECDAFGIELVSMMEGFDRFGRIDIVVANAGIYTPTPVQFATSEQLSETIDINLTGVFNTVKVAVRRMIEQREGGAIAITSSIAGLKGMYGTAAYNASKHGVVGFMRSIALELAPQWDERPEGSRGDSEHPAKRWRGQVRREFRAIQAAGQSAPASKSHLADGRGRAATVESGFGDERAASGSDLSEKSDLSDRARHTTPVHSHRSTTPALEDEDLRRLEEDALKFL